MFPKKFTQDYLANSMLGAEATKIKVYHPDYHEDGLHVFLKAVKDGWVVITIGWTKVVRAFDMKEGTIWAFRFYNCLTAKMTFGSLYTAFNTHLVHCCDYVVSIILQH